MYSILIEYQVPVQGYQSCSSEFESELHDWQSSTLATRPLHTPAPALDLHSVATYRLHGSHVLSMVGCQLTYHEFKSTPRYKLPCEISAPCFSLARYMTR